MTEENKNHPLSTPEEIRRQTADLWRTCFNDSDEFIDLYFSEKYTAESNITLRPEGSVVAATQILPYRLRYLGTPIRVCYVSGLCVDPAHRGHNLSAQLLRRAHRAAYERGDLLSLLIPGDEGLRRFYEKPEHGAYWTATFRRHTDFTADDAPAKDLTVEAALEWPDDLYWAYRAYNRQHIGIEVTADDFYTALSALDIAGGDIIVARRGRQVQGLCLARPAVDGEVRLLSFCYKHPAAANAILSHLFDRPGVERISQLTATSGNDTQGIPYAMARVLNVERLLRHIARLDPRLELSIGVDGDLDIPENNGYYHISGGSVSITDQRPDLILTPGGLAAYFMGAYPFRLEMLLDE